ncbi:MAG TPA: host attachment protein [Chromatiaceae bacterium]|jgi:protein required for attachment to host cells|nr:host attachment protein [Chromatiaceae bacterium]
MMTTWVLVADTYRARLFGAERPASPLTELRDLASPEARLHEGDLVTDKGGRDRNPMGGGHGLGADGGHKHDVAERFAQQICDLLETARVAGQLSKLYVIAAPAFLGMLRRHQSHALKQLVVGEIDKSIAGQEPASIRKHLPEYL